MAMETERRSDAAAPAGGAAEAFRAADAAGMPGAGGTARPAAPAAADSTVRQPAVPVRRVGAFTLGLSLIAAGICLLCYYFVPGFDFMLAARLAPLALISLGGEVLYFAARPGRCRCDFASVLLCLVLMVGCMAVSFVPVFVDYALRIGLGPVML